MTPSRDYERAMSRLETLTRYFEAEGREERLSKLVITIKSEPGFSSPPSDFVAGLEKLIREDLQRLGARMIHAAQDEAKKAGEALIKSVSAELKSGIMRD